MTDRPVRLRIAPSPTGEPHIGTAYTALFNVLLARKLGGVMILRIEDTDQTRSTPEAEEKLMAALNWIGLPWSEGPDKGGPYGPYRQSERRDLYRPYVDELVAKGHAFKCYCTRERLEDMRREQKARGEQTKYDGLCLRRSAEELASLEAAGTPYVVRMKVPAEGECVFEDGVYGAVSIPFDGVDMQVILKADGMPTYHFANVVDDHLMQITHVARGEEWLSSVPKHLLLYQYFGWTPPAWYHLPLMRNPDRSKLSKRRNPTSLSYFSGVGYLPEALVNFLGLFFISVAEGEEMMDLSQLEEKFDPAGMSKAGAVFDMTKLAWLNGRWIREKLTPEQFSKLACAWAAQDGKLQQFLTLAQSRISLLGDLPPLIGFGLTADLRLSKADFEATKLSSADCLAIIRAVQPLVETAPAWTKDALHAEVEAIASGMGKKLRNLVPPLFVALTGGTKSLPLFDSMEALGRSIVRQRLAQAVAVLS
ncbi:MAG TPA: glutamate--tRNA ligase [Methylocystis sp.]|nr:glutamate--tRNA ligase [Methylocystis sp.]